ncbi:hypothetical protein ERJ70_03125 [Sediminibacillus dalangtanensis]|uniref:Uncharacterized protein n=1 Tax=Sediminibacillus dalangtanensis TaxID=2729421 RepID=A0ABX7VVM5_9BACI|nr:hypothetical protein [Sediminibacillus dalangtanensis]QTM98397.1 hypothetical protein ERJ70_03125 [Sediminibacillus dalangtanensis]
MVQEEIERAGRIERREGFLEKVKYFLKKCIDALSPAWYIINRRFDSGAKQHNKPKKDIDFFKTACYSN